MLPLLSDSTPITADPILAKRHKLAQKTALLHKAGLEKVQQFLARHPQRGMEAAARIAALRDRLLKMLYQHALAAFPNSNPGTAEQLAVVAQGGYGRGLSAPFSDMDLIFLIPAKPLPWCEMMIESMLYPLWDAGLVIGHTVGTPQNQLLAAQKDNVRRTALLDIRLLAGEESLFQELQVLTRRQFTKKSAPAFVAAKLAEREKRHQKAGSSRYMVEPDVKNGKGGVRDIQTLDWISQYCYGQPAAETLAARKILSEAEQRKQRRAANFLWAVRCQLHFIANRAEENLRFEHQIALAGKFLPKKEVTKKEAQKKQESPVRRAERFMKTYFLAAQQTGDLTRILCALLEAEQTKPPAFSRLWERMRRRSAPKDFTLTGGRLQFAANALSNPLNLLRLFYEAAKQKLPLHPEALANARASAPNLVPKLRALPEAGVIFLDLLLQPDVEEALRRMHEAGVLGRFIPEFGRIAGQMQFNLYHHYTVDEHSLRALGELANLRFGRKSKQAEQQDIELLPALFRRLKKPDLHALFLAVLCHDIAKGGEKNHSLAGAEIARRLARKLGLPKEGQREAAFLVANHLAMSHVAQTRDLTDEKTIAEFARLVETPTRLSLLLLLTIADIRAVGPGVWTGWKAALLGELYRKSLRFLSPQPVLSRPEKIIARKKRTAAKLQDWPAGLRTQFLDLWPESYWLSATPQRLAAEARLWRSFQEGGGDFQSTRRELSKTSVSEVIVLAHDHPGLFARLAAGFALDGLNIVEARLFTGRDGSVLDKFFVQTRQGRGLKDARRMARLEALWRDLLAGKTLTQPAFAAPAFQQQRRRLAVFPARPEISCDNEASHHHTLVEVNAPARPGLLAALAAEFFHAGLRVHEARIADFGERAVDVFSLSDGAGQKLNPQRQQALTRRLAAMLAPATPSSAKPSGGAPLPSGTG